MGRDYITDIFIKNATSLTEKREILSLTEAEQTAVSNNMINKLFDSALRRSNVDFEDIPKSKGDITKYSGYKDMVESIAILKQLVAQSKVKIQIPELDIIDRAIGNIVANRNLFETGIKLQKDFVILLYNTLVSACIIGTSRLITSYIDYVKRVDNIEFQIVNTDNNMGSIQIQSLKAFNESVASGEFVKSMNFIIKNNNKKIVDESITAAGVFASAFGAVKTVVGAIAVPAGIILGIIGLVNIIRLGVFYLTESRMKIANFLEMQAMFLELNKNNINSQSYNVSPDKKKQVLEKQQKLIDKLRSIAAKLTADLVVSEKKALDNIEKENSGWKFADVKTDSVASDSSGYQLL